MVCPDSSAGKESACNAGDPGLIPGLGRSPGEGKVYPFQYSGLENSMDCVVHGVTNSQTRLSEFHFTLMDTVLETLQIKSPDALHPLVLKCTLAYLCLVLIHCCKA